MGRRCPDPDALVKRAVLLTWAGAAIVSVLNPSLLWPLTVPPLAPLAFYRWLPFLWVPLCAGLAAASLSLLLRRSIILANIAFWGVFFLSAELWRAHLMSAALPENAICAERHSFIRSLTFGGNVPLQFDVHAAAVLDGGVRVWSYRAMTFFEIGPGIYGNLDFSQCREAVNFLMAKEKP